MNLSVSGKQIDVGDALRSHVASELESMVDKYFDAAIEGNVVFSREAHRHQCDIQVHIGRGMTMQSEGAAEDIYVAFDMALERMAKRLRRYKRRLRNHHAASIKPGDAELVAAQQYVLAAEAEDGADQEEPDHLDPVIVAEMSTAIRMLTVGEAVMHLDLTGQPAMLFRNRAHGGLNMIYRRPDGNIGWVDPRNLSA